MIFIDACMKKETPYTPTWFMRQAGRYLEEYRAVRASAKDFISMCKNPALATEVTLQPIDILDVDAAILFSDILMLPYEMGLELEFITGEGPTFHTTIRDKQDCKKMQKNISSRLAYVYDALSQIRSKLPKEKALIGFSGAPWTLATYIIEGSGSKSYTHSKKMLYQNPALLREILQILSDELKTFLECQIKAGANALMIFDSWAGALESSAYMEFGYSYINDIATHIKKKYSNIPLIVFPKGVGGFLESFQDSSANFDVFGIDWAIPMCKAKQILSAQYVLQGNLEPARLYDYDAMIEGTDRILEAMGRKNGWIFNLGHGMLPDLPRENAIRLVQYVREKTSKLH